MHCAISCYDLDLSFDLKFLNIVTTTYNAENGYFVGALAEGKLAYNVIM